MKYGEIGVQCVQCGRGELYFSRETFLWLRMIYAYYETPEPAETKTPY